MMSRRDFVRTTAVSVLAPPLGWVRSHRSADQLNVGFLRGPGAAAENAVQSTSGFELGIGEARHAAILFGKSIASPPVSSDPAKEARATIATLAESGVQAIVFDGNASDAAAAAGESAQRGIVFVNATCTADSLREAACSRFVYHVAPSDSMREAARSLVVSISSVSPAPLRIETWHPSLVRYGAVQLNDRFRPGSGERMGSVAWGAWMSVKILWEAFLRANEPTSSGIVEYLSRESSQFDGHKGIALSFRSWDHQLRQPLYAISADETSAIEIPALSRPDVSTKDLLDMIGARRRASTCA